MSQRSPPHRGTLQAPASLAGQQGPADPAEWAAETLNCLANFDRPHAGQTGFSFPRTSTSNAWPQWRQTYS